MKTKIKQLFSGFLSTIITVSSIQLPVSYGESDIERYPYTFFAGASTDGAITINADNVCINGNIATNGTISSPAVNFQVNGTKSEKLNETMIQCFGIIDETFFAASEVETYFEDYFLEETNINVDTPIEAEGNINLTGNISISSGLKALHNVNLNGNVENSQYSAIYSQTGDIIIDTDNLNLNGIVYAPNGAVNISAMNLNLNSVIIIADTITITCPNLNANYNAPIGEIIGKGSKTEENNENNESNEEELELIAFGEYLEDDKLKIYWDTTVPQGSFDIQISDNGENYISIDTVNDADSYEYTLSESLTQQYIKVVETTNAGKIGESIPFLITHNDEGYDISFLDSDEDELPDLYELRIGTHIDNADSDEDGLSDYQEAFVVGSDPTIYDSITEGLADSEADSDCDGLSNIYEITIKTNTQNSDTDEDFLSDYDELFVYFTDPLVADSDEDGIEDGSEIKLGLDPNNPETFGIPDAEYKVKQSISSDNELLSAINTEESPYELSIEMKTNGDIEKEVNVLASGYSNVIDNDAMLGASLDISASDMCSPEDIVIKYDIKSDYIDNTLGKYSSLAEFQGIKRLNVFKFDEEEGMLLPVNTEFSEDSTQLYAEVDELGTYCIMDMEIWLDNLGAELINNNSSISDMKLNVSTIKIMSDEAPMVNKFSFNGHTYARYDITGMSWNDAQKRCSALGGHLVTINSSAEQNFINTQLLANSKANTYWIGCSFSNGNWKWVTDEVFNFINWDLGEPNNLNIEHYVHIYGKSKDDITIGKWNNTIKNNCNSGTFFDTFYCGFICEWDNVVEYEILLPTCWKKVKLEAEISPNNGANTDKDGFTDWEEVDTSRLIWHNTNSFEVPTITVSDIVKNIDRFKSKSEYKFLLDNSQKIKYLPILSDPTDADTDDDKIPDKYSANMKMEDDWYAFDDPNPLKSDVTETKLKHDFFSVDYEFRGSKDWTLFNNKNIASYGGYQGWFGTYGPYGNTETFGFINNVSGDYIHRDGCGLIAIGDMFYYLLLQNGSIDKCVLQNNQYSHISFDDYTNYIINLSEYVFFYPIIQGTVSDYLNFNLSQSINDIQRDTHLNLDVTWCSSTNKEKCLNKIKEMISNDIPVVYSYCASNGLQLYCFHNYCNTGFDTIEFYSDSPLDGDIDLQHNAPKVKSHYMVATAVIEYSDDVSKIIGRKIMIKTATYGKKYYVDFDEYTKSLSKIDTNIFYITR